MLTPGSIAIFRGAMNQLEEMKSSLRGIPLFRGLSELQFNKLIALMRMVSIPPGQTLIEEGEEAQELFVLLRGEVEVVKREPKSRGFYRLTILKPVTVFGEVPLLDGSRRSASVRTLNHCMLASLGYEHLGSQATQAHSIETCIKISLGKELASSLRRLSETTVTSLRQQLEEAKARATAGTFVISMFVSICMYIFALQITSSLVAGAITSTVVTVPIIVLFSFVFAMAIRKSGHPLSSYGLTTRKGLISAIDAIRFSIPVFAAIVLIKIVLLHTHPGMAGEPLFRLMENIRNLDIFMIKEATAYCIFSPFQEFIARGSVQTAFHDFLVGKHSKWKSILVANLLFSMMHLHLSLLFAVLAFFPGLFWGWLYARQRNLVGVSISHILIGLFAFYVVGFQGALY